MDKKKLKEMGVDAFLGIGWEEVRYKVPKGKFRVVLVDMFDHTATIIQDFDNEEPAKKYVLENKDILGEYESLVIYDDESTLVYDSDWREEKMNDKTLEEFMELVRRELGSERFEEYIKTALTLSEKKTTSLDDIIETAIQVDSTAQDKLRNLFFTYAFLGLMDAELGAFAKSVGKRAMEVSGFKDPMEVYRHIDEMKELTEDVKSLGTISGLKFGYDFKLRNAEDKE